MRLKIMSLALVLMAAVGLAACNAVDTTLNTSNNKASQSAVAPETTYPDGARRITTGELEALMNEGKAYVVDVRTQDSYDMGHIPGSKLIPVNDILKHVDQLPRDKMIVTYCS